MRASMLLLAALSGAALAQDVDLAGEAELHFQRGVDAYLRGQHMDALEHLLLSNRLAPNPAVAYNIGRTYELLQQYNNAFSYYSMAATAWENEPSKRAQAEASIAAIRGQIALLEITSEPAGATIYVDRINLGQRGVTPKTIAVDPGEHEILLELEGHVSRRVGAIEAVRGEQVSHLLTMTPLTAPVLVQGSPAGAEIRLDGPEGRLLGTIPAEISLPVGTQDLYIHADVHTPQHPQLVVREGQNNRLVVDLALITGTVLVDATENNALIAVDGQPTGFTPAVLQVPAGRHQIEVRAAGYQPYTIDVDVSAEEDQRITAALLPHQEVTAASRRAQRVSEAPASVSLVSAQEIRAFGYQSVWEAVGSVRGAYQTDDLTYRFLGLRGFSIAGDYGNRTLLTLDGHTYNDDLIGASYPAEGLMTDLRNVSQIEVVRGPGSALYGSNAFFGVINVVTGKGTERPRDGISVAAVRDGQVRAQAGAGMGDNTRGLWASASGTHGQGLDYAFPELDPGGDGQVTNNDALSAGTMMARAWAGDVEVQAHISVRDKQIPTAAFDTLLDDDRATSRDGRTFVEMRYAPQLSGKLELDSRAWLDQYTFFGVFPYAREDGGVAEERWRGMWAGAEPRLRWEPVPQMRITLGGEARMQVVGDFVGTQRSSGEVYLDETLLPRVFSGYAEVDMLAANWLTIIAGGRVDHYSTFGLAASPRLAAVMQPSPRDTVKLLAGRAFRAPSVYELTYNDNNNTQATATDLGAETIVTVEGEYTHRLGEVTAATVDVFYNAFDGLIDTYLNADGLYEYDNTDEKVHSVGSELEILRDWRGGWMVSSSYSWQRTRYGTLMSDDAPTNSPTHRLLLKGASPTGPGGVRLASLTCLESARMTAAGRQTEPAILWDVTATGDVRDAIQWSLGVRNLLNWQSEHPGGYDLRQDTVPQRGRNVFLELTHTR